LHVKRETSEFGRARRSILRRWSARAVYERYQDDAYTKGLRVLYDLLTSHQEAAYQAVRSGAQDYDRPPRLSGARGHADLPAKLTEEALEDALQDTFDSDGLYAAVVVEASRS
jgi:penicillin-binding protein 1A